MGGEVCPVCFNLIFEFINSIFQMFIIALGSVNIVVTLVNLLPHCEQVNYPSDEKQAHRTQVEDCHRRATQVELMCTENAQGQPQDIGNGNVSFSNHNFMNLLYLGCSLEISYTG